MSNAVSNLKLLKKAKKLLEFIKTVKNARENNLLPFHH